MLQASLDLWLLYFSEVVTLDLFALLMTPELPHNLPATDNPFVLKPPESHLNKGTFLKSSVVCDASCSLHFWIWYFIFFKPPPALPADCSFNLYFKHVKRGSPPQRSPSRTFSTETTSTFSVTQLYHQTQNSSNDFILFNLFTSSFYLHFLALLLLLIIMLITYHF